jgi:FlaA1/EpsC-like NDP-sugar epimerase
VIETLLKYRRLFVVGLHIVLVVLSNYLAFWLRFDGTIPALQMTLWRHTLLWLIVIRGFTFVPFRLYQGLWRYTGIWDLRNIIGGVLASTVVFYGLIYWVFGLTGYPKSVLVIDSVLLICCMGGIRLGRRLCRELGAQEGGKRVLVYGAGDAGEMIVRDMRNHHVYPYKPVGFIDDDPAKVGRRIHGVRVLGSRQNLPRAIAAVRPDELLVAMPSATPSSIREVVKALEPFKIPIKTLPNLHDVIDGKVSIGQIRTLAVEDLLTRAPVGLKPRSVRQLISDKTVLVTGAGGSIGSELCRQIATLKPRTLILLERYENSLYAISGDLSGYNGSLTFRSVIGDVTDTKRVYAVLEAYHPDIVFHAAAHKHVPLMEGNPCEAVKNNVLGTRTMAEAAAKFGVECFILISTDKAVNPSSVMGATKRMAEFVMQDLARRSATRFLAVRFGNVLGSNGSVVPRFLSQIQAGGPVTVTHPDVRRYFMLIPEAVSLVLHAAALGQRGAIYVLDMGEQIRVLDMARNLIRLSGFVPEEEIPIVFVGLRPGEKLYEELVGEDETLLPSGVDKISQVQSGWLPAPEVLEDQLVALERLALQGQAQAVLDVLCKAIPTFRPHRPTRQRSDIKLRAARA